MSRAPKVTVLMPVHNAAPYLLQAVESVLAQSFQDFEFLILDDASTDGSAPLLDGCRDARITLVKNPVRRGVAATLNAGIALARGRYLARMDADDVSLPERLAQQVAFLDERPEVSLVGVKVVLIDGLGEERGAWEDDQACSAQEILALLPKRNCIAHPGVMLRSEVARQFLYREEIRVAQDYDLWLRIAAAGGRIEKLDRVLLKYRVHSRSVTWQSNERDPGLKNVRVKAGFLSHRFARRLAPNRFTREVGAALAVDLFGLAKGRVRELARESLVRAGMLLGASLPLQNRSGLFFFFPFHHVGGGERVHAEIVKTASGKRPWIFITHRSLSAALKGEFAGAGKLIDLSRVLDNVVGQALARGCLASLINRCDGALTFGANTPFYYTLLPYLRGARCVDLIHAFGGGIESESLPYLARLERRIVINPKTRRDLEEQYARCGVDPGLAARIEVVENKVAVPEAPPRRGAGGELRVLYVGRGSAEKRVHLVAKVARLLSERGVPACFTLVGDVVDAVAPTERRYCRFLGELSDTSAMAARYRESDLLLLSSSREGFPMVIMEAMAHGVIPVATDVGGIGCHIKNGENGFLVENGSDEDEIVARFVALLERLSGERPLLDRLSLEAHRYAAAHFRGESFDRYYRSLFRVGAAGAAGGAP